MYMVFEMERGLLNYRFINLLHKAVTIMVYKKPSQEDALHFCSVLQVLKNNVLDIVRSFKLCIPSMKNTLFGNILVQHQFQY